MKKIFLFILILLLIALGTADTKFVFDIQAKLAEVEPIKPELVLQTGHSTSVKTVVFSPDNQWVASGSVDNTVKIWEFETGRELRALVGHTGAIKALARTTDGSRLASGSNDKTVKIWEVVSGKEINSFAVQDGSVEAIAFSFDGQKLAVGSSGNTVTIRDTANGQELYKLAEHTGAITALAFSRDGRFLASGSSDNTVKVWDVSKGRRIRTLAKHTDKIKALQFSEDGENLVSGSFDKTVRLWKTSNGRELSVFRNHTGKVLTINFMPGGKLLSADSDHIIKFWDIPSERELSSVVGRTGDSFGEEGESAVFSSDGKFLATGNGDRTAALFDAKTGEKLRILENHTSGSNGVAFSSDRHWLAAASIDNTVKLWDLQTGQGLSPLKGHTGYVTCLVFHPNNQNLASSSIDGTIKVWDVLLGKTLYTLPGNTGSVKTLAIGSKGRLLVSGGIDQTVRLWNLETKSQIGTLTGHAGEVTSVSISPNEQIIASASTDKTIKLWDVRAQAELRTLNGHTGKVDSVAFSPDGRFLVSGSADKTVRVWEVATGRELQIFTGHTGEVNSVSFSPDGKQIASASQDKTVRFWNVSNGREERIMIGHVGMVSSLSFTTDGQWLASGSEDGSIIVWKKEDGNRLATLISLKNNGDWLVITPEGFFDGSPPAWDQILWRFGKNTFNIKPVEVFFNEFYSPNLLANLLAGEKLPSTSNISNKDRRQPQVEISLADGKSTVASISERQVKVKVNVSEVPSGNGYQTGSGARDVRLFRNGSLVKFWSGNVIGNNDKAELETTITLVNGKNQLSVYAFNNDNIKTTDAILTINGSEKLKRKGTLYIVGIGVGEYANPKYNLSYVELDAKKFIEQLLLKQSELKQYERVEIIPLLSRDATKSNILAAFQRLAGIEQSGASSPLLNKLQRAQPEDTVAVFFSGHGTSQNGRFYILPYDLGYGDPNLPLDAERLKTVLSHSISDLELEQAFREIDVGHLILVVDACNSGQAIDPEDKRRGPMNTKGLAQLANDKGMYILTASQSLEAAYVSLALKRSYLSFALIEEGLKTPEVADVAPKDGLLSIREWFDYATNRVPQLRQDVTSGLLKVEQDKGLEEVEEKPVKNVGTQRPRVFYRRQADLLPLIISQVE